MTPDPDTFTCTTCARPAPASEGAADERPDECSECWLAGLSLTDRLRQRGLTHRPAGVNAREVVDAEGAVVWTGNAQSTWLWLREMGRNAGEGASATVATREPHAATSPLVAPVAGIPGRASDLRDAFAVEVPRC